MSDSIWRFISTSVSSSRAASVKSPCCWHKKAVGAVYDRPLCAESRKYARSQTAPTEREKKGATPKECAPLGKPAIRLSPLTPCENETTLNAGSRKSEHLTT